ncbi:hypothetical protein N2152v2_000584 [Parachlorella kessleri]
MSGLQALHYLGPHFLPDDFVAVAGLTALTSLSCNCWLDGVVAPFHSLSSLSQLRMLDLIAQGLRPGEQLPDSLAALSKLETLAVSAGFSSEPDTHAYVRLPWKWCRAAAQLSCLHLLSVDLPQLAGTAASNDSCNFPALSELNVWQPVEPLSTSALVCCQSVKVLRIDCADLGGAGLGGVFALLTNLESLDLRLCDLPPADEEEPPSQLLSRLTALTGLTLYLYDGEVHPSAFAQLPALRRVEVDRAGWPGSVAAALRQSTRLTSLVLDHCPLLRISKGELPLLLALPLRAIKVNKNPFGIMASADVPSPLWDEDSLWVVNELRHELWRRRRPSSKPAEWVNCDICTEEWEREEWGSEEGDDSDE